MPKVSVIVPVFGVEHYISRCAESLFEQTLDDIEYLFIDDCTPDHSIDLLKAVLSKYPKRMANTRILKMAENSGQAAVRKYGILMARGEFIAFCDSDDWVDVTMYEKMYEDAIKKKSEMVICDFYSSNGVEKIRHKGVANTVEKKQLIADLITQKCNWSLCNKITKRELYKECVKEYPISNLGEDMAIVLQLTNGCKSISYIDSPYYYYYQNPNSITKTVSKEAVRDKYYQFNNNLKIVEKVFSSGSIENNYCTELVALRFFGLTKLWPMIRLDRSYYKLWNHDAGSIFMSVVKNPYISVRKRIKYYLTFVRLYP